MDSEIEDDEIETITEQKKYWSEMSFEKMKMMVKEKTKIELEKY